MLLKRIICRPADLKAGTKKDSKKKENTEDNLEEEDDAEVAYNHGIMELMSWQHSHHPNLNVSFSFVKHTV